MQRESRETESLVMTAASEAGGDFASRTVIRPGHEPQLISGCMHQRSLRLRVNEIYLVVGQIVPHGEIRMDYRGVEPVALL